MIPSSILASLPCAEHQPLHPWPQRYCPASNNLHTYLIVLFDAMSIQQTAQAQVEAVEVKRQKQSVIMVTPAPVAPPPTSTVDPKPAEAKPSSASDVKPLFSSQAQGGSVQPVAPPPTTQPAAQSGKSKRKAEAPTVSNVVPTSTPDAQSFAPKRAYADSAYLCDCFIVCGDSLVETLSICSVLVHR